MQGVRLRDHGVGSAQHPHAAPHRQERSTVPVQRLRQTFPQSDRSPGALQHTLRGQAFRLPVVRHRLLSEATIVRPLQAHAPGDEGEQSDEHGVRHLRPGPRDQEIIVPAQGEPQPHQTVPVRLLRQESEQRRAFEEAQAHPHGGETVRVRHLRKRFHGFGESEDAQEGAHGGEAVQVRPVPESFLAEVDVDHP